MRPALASHLVMLVVGLSLGVGAVAVADDQAPAHSSAIGAGDRAIVKELRKLQSQIGTSQYDSNSLRSELQKQVGNPFSPSVKELLRDICLNVSTSFGDC